MKNITINDRTFTVEKKGTGDTSFYLLTGKRGAEYGALRCMDNKNVLHIVKLDGNDPFPGVRLTDVGGVLEQIFVDKDEPETKNTSDWLPGDLDDDLRKTIKKLASKIDYEIDTAAALAVSILQACNAHTEAKKVNDLLMEMFNADATQVFCCPVCNPEDDRVDGTTWDHEDYPEGRLYICRQCGWGGHEHEIAKIRVED